MDYKLIENKLNVDDFIRLQKEGFGENSHKKTAQISLDGSLYVIHAELDGKVIGMARLIGDGGYINFLADMIVVPEHQGKGIGRAILKRVIDYVKANIPEGGYTQIVLSAAKGKDPFYQKFGFVSRPNEEEGCGMQLRIVKY